MPDNVRTPAPKPGWHATPQGFTPDEHDALLQQYAEAGAKYGPLWSRYGPGNITERQFKALQAAVAVEIRSAKASAQEKVSEAYIADAANADKRIDTFLHATEMGRLAYQQAEIEMTMLTEKLRHLDAVLRRGI